MTDDRVTRVARGFRLALAWAGGYALALCALFTEPWSGSRWWAWGLAIALGVDVAVRGLILLGMRMNDGD